MLAQLRDEKQGSAYGDRARSEESAYNAPTYEAREDEDDGLSSRRMGRAMERFPGDGGFTDPEERGRFGRAQIPDYEGAYVAPAGGGGGLPGSGEDEDDSDAELDAMMNDLGAEGGAIAR